MKIIFYKLIFSVLVATIFYGDIFAHDLPIRTHLIDATKINYQRMFRYSKLTNNRSLSLSRELILMEELALIATINLDLKARKFHSLGIPVFLENLTDMSLTPKFEEHFTETIAPTQYQNINIKKLKNNWLTFLKNKDLQNIYTEAIEILDNGYLKEKNQNCLTRHLVESIARSIMLLPEHLHKTEPSLQNELESLSLDFISIQIRSLVWTNSLDKRAFFIQKSNIPFFCQDVPPISYK